jgi:maleate isomerase
MILQEIEDELNRPVISSNQALMWHALQLLGKKDKTTGFGRLFNH